MVPGLHYQRGLHVDRYPAVEEISVALHCKIHAKHYSDDRVTVLHYGPFHNHDVEQDQELAGRFHRGISWP
jgi:hypothetical protein